MGNTQSLTGCSLWGRIKYFLRRIGNMKEFMLDGQKYSFEYDAKNKTRKVKLFLNTQQGKQDLYGNQKVFIVKKLHELMQENPHIEISEKTKQYIEDYINGIRRDASETTNTLGKILYDCL